MRKTICCLLILVLLLSGCRKVDTYDEELQSKATSSDGIIISLDENVLSPKAEWINVTYENPTEKDALYGEGFHVYKQSENGSWLPLSYIDHLAFPAVGYTLEKHTAQHQSFSLKIFKEPLSEGIYRIHIDAFKVDLEFAIRKGGAKPERFIK